MAEKVLTMEPQHTGLITEDVFCCVTEIIDLVSIQEEFPVICRLPLPRVKELPQHNLQSHKAPLSAKQAVLSSICSVKQLASPSEQQFLSAWLREGRWQHSTAALPRPTSQLMGTQYWKAERALAWLHLPTSSSRLPTKPCVLPCGRLALTWPGQTWGCGQRHGSACPRCQSPC